MAEIVFDMDTTFFLNGQIGDEGLNAGDFCNWLIETYTEKKEELAAAREERKGMSKKELASLPPLPERPEFTLVINSVGGEYDHMIQIYDTLQLLDIDVRTIVSGAAFSAAAWLAISGTPGKRYITPTSRLMFHSASSGTEGKVTDMKIDFKEMERLNIVLKGLLVKHTNITEDKALKLVDRDYYMLPQEALQEGIVDEMVTKIG